MIDRVKFADAVTAREFVHIPLQVLDREVVVDALVGSYVQKLVTELSGGVFGYLDSVLERHSFDEFGELI